MTALRCYLLGHRLKWRDEGSANIGAAAKCVRCWHEVPAVVWSGIHESKTRSNMKPLMAASHRPPPPMPACKPPAQDGQAQILAEIKALREEARQMRDDAKQQQGEIIATSIFAASMPSTSPTIPQPSPAR